MDLLDEEKDGDGFVTTQPVETAEKSRRKCVAKKLRQWEVINDHLEQNNNWILKKILKRKRIWGSTTLMKQEENGIKSSKLSFDAKDKKSGIAQLIGACNKANKLKNVKNKQSEKSKNKDKDKKRGKKQKRERKEYECKKMEKEAKMDDIEMKNDKGTTIKDQLCQILRKKLNFHLLITKQSDNKLNAISKETMIDETQLHNLLNGNENENVNDDTIKSINHWLSTQGYRNGHTINKSLNIDHFDVCNKLNNKSNLNETENDFIIEQSIDQLSNKNLLIWIRNYVKQFCFNNLNVLALEMNMDLTQLYQIVNDGTFTGDNLSQVVSIGTGLIDNSNVNVNSNNNKRNRKSSIMSDKNKNKDKWKLDPSQQTIAEKIKSWMIWRRKFDRYDCLENMCKLLYKKSKQGKIFDKNGHYSIEQWKNAIDCGTELTCIDIDGMKCGAIVLRRVGNHLLIHYRNFSRAYDEWIGINDSRLSPLVPNKKENEANTLADYIKTPKECVRDLLLFKNINYQIIAHCIGCTENFIRKWERDSQLLLPVQWRDKLTKFLNMAMAAFQLKFEINSDAWDDDQLIENNIDNDEELQLPPKKRRRICHTEN